MADIDVVIIDPGGYAFKQRLDDQMAIRALVPLLVPRLGLPKELNYYLIPKATGQAMNFTDTLASIGATPGAQIELRPARDDIFARILDDLYKKAEKYVADQLWKLAKEQLDILFRVAPDHPDPQGLRQRVEVHIEVTPQPQPAISQSANAQTQTQIPPGCWVGVIAIAIVFGLYVYNRKSTEPTLGTGDIQATLRWSGTNDLDLSVTDPSGETIWYKHKKSQSGGTLDVDSNRECENVTSEPVENVFWSSGTAPRGRYIVNVHYFKQCSDDVRTSFRVNLKIGSRNDGFSGVIGPGQRDGRSFDY